MTSQPTSRFSVKPALLFTFVFFLSVVARMVFSPMLLRIEHDIGIGHAAAGSLFLFISLGYAPMILLSGFVASRLTHRGTIMLSFSIVGASMFFISTAGSITPLRIGMFLLGAGAGLYVSSGLASLMSAVPSVHWGKAISFHEAAPNIATISAPLIALLALELGTWRDLTRVLAVLCIGAGLVFGLLNRSARFRGAAPRFAVLKHYFEERSFWILAGLFALSACAALGVYSVLPTYAVAERGMRLEAVNSLMSAGRSVGLVLVFASGYLSDRIGINRILAGSVVVTGVLTILLGALPTGALPVIVFVQPMLTGAFFPAGLTAMAHIGPQKSQNVGVSLTVFCAILVGGGIYPAIMGRLGDQGRFYLGFIVLGVIMCVAVVLVRFMRITHGDAEEASGTS